MYVLGIQLKTPTMAGFLVALLVIGLALGLMAIFAELSPPYVLGVAAGSLASAYGASPVTHGWRAMVVIVCFASVMMGMVALLDAVIH